MKTKILISILALLLSAGAICQKNTIELTFEAENIGTGVSLDKIFIENLTQGDTVTIYEPVLLLVYTDIGDYQSLMEKGFSVSQNYPNPFNQQTQVNLYLPEKEYIQITIYDILGRELASFKNTLNRGNHTFTFYPGNVKNYLLNVTGKQTSKTIKMLNAGNNLTSSPQCRIVYNAFNETPAKFKSQKAINDLDFNLGDTLRFTGFAETFNGFPGSDMIIDAPEVDSLYKFEIIDGIPCPETPTVTYQGQIYNTVLIGGQCWFKENLNVGTMIPGLQEMANDGIIEKYCYNDEPDSCAKYGGLYQWDEMMQYTLTQGVQGICPEGWHLPTDFGPSSDWCTLNQFIDPTVDCDSWAVWTGTDIGTKMKSTTGWNEEGNGTNTHGFTVIPGGIRGQAQFNHIGNKATFWSSSDALPGVGAWGLMIEHNNASIFRLDYFKYQGRSVRCVKN